MKAALYYGTDDIRCEEVPRPQIGPGEILVRVRSCGLCGTDVSKIVHRTVTSPRVLGHEVAGEVEEVGKGVKKFSSGDRVGVAHHVPCQACHYCRHGNYSLCAQFLATNIDPGGFAEYIRVSALHVEKTTFLLPDHLSYEEASFIEPLACTLRALERASLQEGDTLAVVGAGPAGLLHLCLASVLGAGQVIVLDLLEERLNKARELGARETINPSQGDASAIIKALTEGRGADVVLVAVGNTQAITQAVKLVRPGGTVLIFAQSPAESLLKLDPNIIYHAEINFVGSYSSAPSGQERALELLGEGKLPIKKLISHRFPLEKLGEAVSLARGTQGVLKIIINP